MSAPIRELIVPNSVRVVVTESTYVAVQCGRCATRFETRIIFRTARCRNCSRVCRLDHPAEAAPNVMPMRRKSAR